MSRSRLTGENAAASPEWNARKNDVFLRPVHGLLRLRMHNLENASWKAPQDQSCFAMPEKTSGPHPSQTQSVPSSQLTSPAETGGIRIKALAAAAEALSLKGRQTEKPVHPLPPCLKDVDRQTD